MTSRPGRRRPVAASAASGAVRGVALAGATVAGFSGASALRADPLITNSYNLFGTPGLIEMPTAEMSRDGDVSGNFSYVLDQSRTTLTFQVFPRLTGSFRYSRIPGYEFNGEDRYDRSFDLRYQVLEETTWLPAVAIGLQDFIGTGLYSGEYIVGTKSLGQFDDVRVTAGLGWGRLATAGVIAGTQGARVSEFVETGGTANFDQFFTGPVSAFGGVSWALSDKLTLKAEYSTDGYTLEQDRGVADTDGPWNFGLDYEVAPGLRFGAYSLHGSQFGILLNFVLNPNEPPAGAGFEPAPVPIQARPRRDSDPLAWSEDWIVNQPTRTGLNETIRTALEAEGVRLDGIVLRANSAEVRIRNDRWRAEAQAHGRTLRVLARFLPASVERITVVPVVNSVPVAAVTYNRSDIERLGNAPGRAILDAAEFSGGGGRRPDDLVQVDPHPKLTYGVAPYLEISLFDPDDPLRYNVGVSFTGALEFAPGLVVSGEVRQPLFGTFDEISRPSNSELPRVRSNFRLYIDDNAPDLNNLQVAWYARPGDQFYSRISAGMLERMFGGVSAELLWKPIDSRIALGAEINYVQQREFDDPFAFQDYDVWTGHASIYYDLENGYFGQIDAGRYLAGDYGATFTAARVFDNGWRVSAYATFTNVPFEEFGEGSFDKGIRVTVPVDWLTGQPTRRTYTTLLQPLTRDGGARLNVPDRLYDRVRLSDQPALEDRAGRFWR